MPRSETRLRTPGVGGRFRELPDGSFEPVPEDGAAPAPAKPGRASSKRGNKARPTPPAPLPLPGPDPAPGRDVPADVTDLTKESGDDAVRP